MSSGHRWRVAYALALAAYAAYLCQFVARSSFVVAGERYFCLFDDSMISMRYARHLAAGHGLVWNLGERVEGFTNPLWVAYMALWHLLPIPSAKLSLGIQLTGIGLLLVDAELVRRLAARVCGGSAIASLAAVLATIAYLPLNNWTLQGTEVGLLAVLVTGGALLVARDSERRAASKALLVLLAVLPWVRIDAVVVAAALIAALLLFGGVPAATRAAAWCGASLALQFALRLAYYGELLPNTYYLKMTGFPVELRLARGALVFWDFAVGLGIALVPLVLGALTRRPPAAILGLVCAVQMAYSVYVGGDAWEWWGGANRFIAPVMPLGFVLLVRGVQKVAAAAARVTPRTWLSRAVAGTTLLASIFATNDTLGVWSLSKGPPFLSPLYVTYHRDLVALALRLRDITDDEASVAFRLAGIVPYFSERPGVDLLGKTDPLVARLPARVGTRSLRAAILPGHDKWDSRHSIQDLRPDVVIGLYGLPADARPYLAAAYRAVSEGGVPLFVRRDSRHVRWDRVDISAPAGGSQGDTSGSGAPAQ